MIGAWQGQAAGAANSGVVGAWPEAQQLASVIGRSSSGFGQYSGDLRQAHSDTATRITISAQRYDATEQANVGLANASHDPSAVIVESGGNNVPVDPGYGKNWTPQQQEAYARTQRLISMNGGGEVWNGTFPISAAAGFHAGGHRRVHLAAGAGPAGNTDPGAISSAGSAYGQLAGKLTEVASKVAGLGQCSRRELGRVDRADRGEPGAAALPDRGRHAGQRLAGAARADLVRLGAWRVQGQPPAARLAAPRGCGGGQPGGAAADGGAQRAHPDRLLRDAGSGEQEPAAEAGGHGRRRIALLRYGRRLRRAVLLLRQPGRRRAAGPVRAAGQVPARQAPRVPARPAPSRAGQYPAPRRHSPAGRHPPPASHVAGAGPGRCSPAPGGPGGPVPGGGAPGGTTPGGPAGGVVPPGPGGGAPGGDGVPLGEGTVPGGSGVPPGEGTVPGGNGVLPGEGTVPGGTSVPGGGRFSPRRGPGARRRGAPPGEPSARCPARPRRWRSRRAGSPGDAAGLGRQEPTLARPRHGGRHVPDGRACRWRCRGGQLRPGQAVLDHRGRRDLGPRGRRPPGRPGDGFVMPVGPGGNGQGRDQNRARQAGWPRRTTCGAPGEPAVPPVLGR